MFILYDFVFILFALFSLPLYLFKGKLRGHFLMRLGILPQDILKLKNQVPIWLHAVSVGEVIAAKPLIKELKKHSPQRRLIISTVTITGNKVAQSLKPEVDLVIYLPLDISFIVRRVLIKIMPCIFIAMETEIWPNLISTLYELGIPIILLNGRISQESFKGYQKIKFVIGSILKKIDLFCMQTKTDAQKIISLGAPEDKVKIIGNMKFDITDYTDFKKDYIDYRLKLGLKEGEKLFVAGSTHPGEEEIILEVYKNLLKDDTNLKLLIAPRHPERTPEVINLIRKFNFVPIRVSLLNEQNELNELNGQTIFILDTIGQLIDFYALADLVFVGGSLVKKGGHNIIEPALFSKAIVFGPHMSNFKDIADLFLEKAAAICVKDKEDLYRNIHALLGDNLKRESLGNLAHLVIAENKGATGKAIQYLNEKISL